MFSIYLTESPEFRLMAEIINHNVRDMLAWTQAHTLLWAVTIIVMLEEDAAMLAFMFT